jgi:hypothetical protein
VNTPAGDGRRGDAGPRWTGFVRTRRRCRRREGFGGQQAHRAESCFATGRKRGEPHDRQRPENGRRVGEGEIRRGGEKPRGRHADGNRHSHPEGGPDGQRCSNGRRGNAEHLREADLPAKDDGGAIFGQPQERKPGRARKSTTRVARTGTRRESRRQGQEGRARRADCSLARTDRRSSRARCGNAPKVEEGSSERPGSRDFDRILPPAGGTSRCGGVARPCPGAVRGRARMALPPELRHVHATQHRADEGALFAAPHEPRGAREEAEPQGTARPCRPGEPHPRPSSRPGGAERRHRGSPTQAPTPPRGGPLLTEGDEGRTEPSVNL